MYKQVITYLIFFAAFTKLIYAQSVIPLKDPADKKSPASEKVKSLSEVSGDADKIEIPNDSRMDFFLHPPPAKTEEKSLQSFVSSFRSNIRFGGFFEKYAVLNFSPSIFIQPLDFISVYGNHNVSYYVPLEQIKQEMKSLCIQGAAILAIDNACKFLFGYGELVPAVANFALKAAVLGLLKSRKNSEIIQYNSFYYAVSVRF